MADIISLKEVADYFHMTMDTKENHTMLVQYSKDKAYHFYECVKDLYYLDVYNPEATPLMTGNSNTDSSFLSTVNVNMEYFTHADFEVEDRERDLQHLLGWPSDHKSIKALSKSLISN